MVDFKLNNIEDPFTLENVKYVSDKISSNRYNEFYFDDIITKNFKKSNKSPIFTTKNYPQFLHLQRLARHGATG